jgi:hypothetical protein
MTYIAKVEQAEAALDAQSDLNGVNLGWDADNQLSFYFGVVGVVGSNPAAPIAETSTLGGVLLSFCLAASDGRLLIGSDKIV